MFKTSKQKWESRTQKDETERDGAKGLFKGETAGRESRQEVLLLKLQFGLCLLFLCGRSMLPVLKFLEMGALSTSVSPTTCSRCFLGAESKSLSRASFHILYSQVFRFP